MSQFQQFIFESYDFEPETKTLHLHYGIDDAHHFTESYVFNFAFASYDPNVLDRAVQNLFFMAGVSYYKAFLPAEIVTKAGELDQPAADFFSKTWQKGLGEFFYTNQLDPKTPIRFTPNIEARQSLALPSNDGLLVGVGGGKDSLVSIELLRDDLKLATWSVGHQEQLAQLVERIGLQHYKVGRTWDPLLTALNAQPGTLNGHVPISAILACVGTIVAVLAGDRDVVVSNEASADEPTLAYQGELINHQYSKSSEFEKDYQAQLQRDFGDGLRYYSILRPLSELRISEIFAQIGMGKYGATFSSCNKAFTQGQTKMSWCGECPKCAFVFLALTPFVNRQQLEGLFGGKNLLTDLALEPTYRQLLGIEGDKPLDCVGEIKESRVALRLAQKHIPQLAKYEFELQNDYNFRALNKNYTPPEIHSILERKLKDL